MGERLETVVRGECPHTRVGEHYGPDAQKEGEWMGRTTPASLWAAARTRATTIAARCELVALRARRTARRLKTVLCLPAGAADGKERKRQGMHQPPSRCSPPVLPVLPVLPPYVRRTNPRPCPRRAPDMHLPASTRVTPPADPDHSHPSYCPLRCHLY